MTDNEAAERREKEMGLEDDAACHYGDHLGANGHGSNCCDLNYHPLG